jgi:hypothetical protein
MVCNTSGNGVPGFILVFVAVVLKEQYDNSLTESEQKDKKF